MAKSRAQRKAEKRKKEERRKRRAQQRAAEGRGEGQAQQDTQAPVSGEVAEAEAVMRTGADPEDYGERVVERGAEEEPAGGSPVPGVVPDQVRPEGLPEELEGPEAPAPSRADVGRPDAVPADESREERRARRRQEKEARRKARAKELQKAQKEPKAPAERAEKRRGGVTGFLASCWAELRRVQWPDRDTLVQASAVTLIFVALAAAYLGALDAAFNWFIQRIL